MTSGQGVSEYLDTLGLVKSYFSSFFVVKIKKIENFFFVVLRRRPEDEAICMFAGLLANPDVPLSLRRLGFFSFSITVFVTAPTLGSLDNRTSLRGS